MLLQSLPLKELVQCRELGTNHGLPTIVGQMADATVAFFATEATHALLCVHCIVAFSVYHLNYSEQRLRDSSPCSLLIASYTNHENV